MLCSKKGKEALWSGLAYFVPDEILSLTSNAIHAEIVVMLCHRQGPNAESTEAYVWLHSCETEDTLKMIGLFYLWGKAYTLVFIGLCG